MPSPFAYALARRGVADWIASGTSKADSATAASQIAQRRSASPAVSDCCTAPGNRRPGGEPAHERRENRAYGRDRVAKMEPEKPKPRDLIEKGGGAGQDVQGEQNRRLHTGTGNFLCLG